MKLKTKPFVACVLAVFFLAIGPVRAALSMYFHMDNIPGDGNAFVNHGNDTVINGFGWNITTNLPGKPAFTVTFQKSIASNSPALALACAKGTTNLSASISCFKPSATTAFYVLSMTNVQVISLTLTNDVTATTLNETIVLRSATNQWSFVPQKSDGTYGTPITTQYP